MKSLKAGRCCCLFSSSIGANYRVCGTLLAWRNLRVCLGVSLGCPNATSQRQSQNPPLIRPHHRPASSNIQSPCYKIINPKSLAITAIFRILLIFHRWRVVAVDTGLTSRDPRSVRPSLRSCYVDLPSHTRQHGEQYGNRHSALS